MIFRRSFPEHFRIIVEEIRVNFIQEPLFSGNGPLQKHKWRAAYPIYKGSGRPGVSERQMKKLEDCEEGSEPINIPVLVLFCYASA